MRGISSARSARCKVVLCLSFVFVAIIWLLISTYKDSSSKFLHQVHRQVFSFENNWDVSEMINFKPVITTERLLLFDELTPEDVSKKGTTSISEQDTTISTVASEHELTVMNLMGRSWTTLDLLNELLGSHGNASILHRMTNVMARVAKSTKNGSGSSNKPTINVAAISCGSRRAEFLVMAKSVLLFSRDAPLHFIVFSDKGTILDVAQDLLELKWKVNSLGWDFTYELHLEWFPQSKGVKWKTMYRKCATQRLFFPSLLPHNDSLIYLDSDIILVSNMTQFWLKFENMGEYGLAAMSANNEDTSEGWYNTRAQTPYYGKRGVSAGVMLMNLTRMRQFGFQNRAIATLELYKEKNFLADQDIVNIIFQAFPERLMQLECSYNFNWVHCDYEKDWKCYKDSKPLCFCKAAVGGGVRVVHGNSGTFTLNFFKFLDQMFSAFQSYNFLMDSPAEMISQLMGNFTSLGNNCRPLTSQILYGNAEDYFRRLKLKGYKV